LDLRVDGSVVIDGNLSSLSALFVFDFESNLFVNGHFLWTTWSDDCCPEVVEHDVISDCNADSHPGQSKKDTKSSFENLGNDSEIAVSVQAYHEVSHAYEHHT